MKRVMWTILGLITMELTLFSIMAGVLFIMYLLGVWRI